MSGNNVKKLRYDILLIAVLLFVSALAVGITLLTREAGERVVVEINGVQTAVYPLSVDGEYPLNGGTNILVIENGEAYLRYADCPDKVCVNTGKIRYEGQTIVCLPNKLSVTVRGTDGGADIVQ
ncbi:MAG: NusG domain II-containing protein [Clostridia bacterium]|nr:NusG domain II-containing protein [Clostridia bacterium]